MYTCACAFPVSVVTTAPCLAYAHVSDRRHPPAHQIHVCMYVCMYVCTNLVADILLHTKYMYICMYVCMYVRIWSQTSFCTPEGCLFDQMHLTIRI